MKIEEVIEGDRENKKGESERERERQKERGGYSQQRVMTLNTQL